MNSLPQLRTARESAQARAAAETAASAQSSAVTTTPPPRRLPPALEHAGVPGSARSVLAELFTVGVLSGAEATAFLRKAGDRLGQLHTRERVGDALVGLGALTRYQVSRTLGGHAASLIVGPYRITDRLNSGSIGTVFAAEHPFMRRPVALKLMRVGETTLPAVVERFETEIRLLAGLNHPHIVAVYDAGSVPAPIEAGTVPATLMYLVMERVTGGDLEQYIYERGTQSVGLACEWGRQIATALDATHAAGLVHRDVKPSNLLLTPARQIKLIDFGLTREFASTATPIKSLIGSLEFMAPEQLADSPTAGPPADVYGLGATLFWVLTGQLPFPQVRTPAEAAEAIRSGQPKRLNEVAPDLPPAIDTLLGRMLSKSPGERPTAAEAAAALAEFAAPSTHPSADAVLGTGAEGSALRAAIGHLEDVVRDTARAAAAARAAVLAGLAGAAAARPTESAGHQRRIAEYARVLASKLAPHPNWPMFADPAHVADLTAAAAAHDLGLVGVPDEVLASPPGEHLPSDRHTYETHPVIGDAILEELAEAHGSALPFLRVARAVVRHHHERWDGTGFPDRLAGDRIPAAARVVAVADAYDFLRGVRNMAHAETVLNLTRDAGVAFDPLVVEALMATEAEFDRIFLTTPDRPGDVELVEVPPEYVVKSPPPADGKTWGLKAKIGGS
ncbi:protein kinase domain-containing protein [Fimbriiglobus ruber]|uniref:Serine/threonine protein kinase PrkC, regulator of stationary phase n=1 Tax=Fimbriiglobus ruber TaxID=1908690 RepID=A0A225D3J7_9BACT|nr:protein kinase [Fimbriiglobus ruber]OWK35533.1 Serine/threonine protein kinase PrkC, regulator of stationary phase [Fimbriiglobus ruber]